MEKGPHENQSTNLLTVEECVRCTIVPLLTPPYVTTLAGVVQLGFPLAWMRDDDAMGLVNWTENDDDDDE